MIPKVPLRVALADPALLPSLAGDSWSSWRILLIAAMGEALSEGERTKFQELTGREREPGAPVEELVAIIGRRGGKSRAIATLACYIAGLCEHPSLVRGETGIVLIIAPDQRQAGICLDYVTASFEQSPILRQLIQSRTADTLALTSGIEVTVRAASYRRVRGATFIAVVLDEAAFLMIDDTSVNPDSEILAAVRPGLATTRGPLFLISSPYARKGELWRAYDRHFGPKGDPLILVAQGSSRSFNPTLPQSVVDRALDRDEAAARAEFLAEFRSDIESFVSLEAVRACVSRGVYERPPEPGITYFGFVDPSGGSADSFTLAIGHTDTTRNGVIAIDALRESRPPFDPDLIVAEFADLLKQYHVLRIVGDKFAGVWPVAAFSRVGISYEQSARPKSELYQSLLPLLNSGRVSLLDDRRLIAQLVGLERRTVRGGRESIDHADGAHDDLANVVAGLCAIVAQRGNYIEGLRRAFGNDDNSESEAEAWYRAKLHNYINSHGMVR
jgi:hypothetical protein